MKSGKHNERVLIVGLGVLGGGLATTKWFLKRGAEVTVTDLRTRAKLATSLKALGKNAKKVRFVLGRHDVDDFKTHDRIVVNPAVRSESPFLAAARKAGNRIENDASIFFDEVQTPVIAVTGTRGKTTTTNWIAHFLGVRAGGNSSADLPLLKLLGELKPKQYAVVELSSWQLELIDQSKKAPASAGATAGKPDIAVITNIYRDHLNRYRGMKEYAAAKANIFKLQTRNQSLVLNADNEWTPFFLKQLANRRIKPRVYFFSRKPLARGRNGIWVNRKSTYFRDGKRTERAIDSKEFHALEVWGGHNIENLLAAVLTARLTGASRARIRARFRTLPQMQYREEIIFARKNLMIVNDSAGTSPDATVAALRRFRGSRVVLIAGGTDKELDFREWAAIVAHSVAPRDLLLLEGSATKNMVAELKCIGYFKSGKPQIFKSLPPMLRVARKLITSYPLLITTLLFSPGAASFEKFRNEFDRGEKFSLYSRKILMTRF
jgi:UDP-N-acetylmuramoylalanine--D-glutamate ligase